MSSTRDELFDEIGPLIEQISILLHGRGPELQGAALADLVAMLFAGHHPALRDEFIDNWVKCMRDLIPVNEAIIFDRQGGKPQGWEMQ